MLINMSHGSGGKSTSDLVSDCFSKHLGNPILNRMEDGAVFSLSGEIAMTTDSFVITPLFYKGGDIGRLAICGTVNDLLMMGATPKYLTAGFIIEEGMNSETLEKIVISMAEAARMAGVIIVAGDTKVVEGKGGLFINTTGIGVIPQGRNISAANCRAGDLVLVSGSLGNHHACIMSERMGIKNNIKSDNIPLNNPVNALFNAGINVKAMRDVTRGGLGTVINELCSSSQVGAVLVESAFPIDEEVSGLCEILGLDPLYMGNEGKFVAIIDKNDKEKAVNALASFEESKNACIIGEIIDGEGVLLKTKTGILRKVGVLTGQGLPRIC